MIIETIVVGPLQVNCYVVYDQKNLQAMIIDPGDNAGRILQFIKSKNLSAGYIICTHGHFDHVGAVFQIKEETQAKIALHKDELEIYSNCYAQGSVWGIHIKQPQTPDLLLKENDVLTAGDVNLKVLHTPGHSPGGICLIGENVIFTGDTIFEGSVGRTDFYGGDIEALKLSFKRILSLPDETKIFPGHGPATSVGDEKMYNFFVHEL